MRVHTHKVNEQSFFFCGNTSKIKRRIRIFFFFCFFRFIILQDRIIKDGEFFFMFE